MCDDSTELASDQTDDSGRPSPAPDPQLIAELVTANRILARFGVVDAFGHVSVRHDKNPQRFLLARNRAPALVGPDDIVEFDLDGKPVNAAGRRVYLERFIHSEILRRRPDVHSVVHSHAPAVIPFGVVASQPLRPVWHMSFFLAGGAPLFEIRDHVRAGDASDLLISSPQLGAALADTLGDHALVLMRGHGATVVGDGIRQAVYRAVYTQLNAELQQRACALGPVEYLTAGETRAAAATVGAQLDRAWDLWASEVTP